MDIGLQLILEDLHKHPERRNISVVCCPLSSRQTCTTENAGTDAFGQLIAYPLQELLHLGVPFVVSSGNKAAKAAYNGCVPQCLTSAKTPLIVAGASTSVTTNYIRIVHNANLIQCSPVDAQSSPRRFTIDTPRYTRLESVYCVNRKRTISLLMAAYVAPHSV